MAGAFAFLCQTPSLANRNPSLERCHRTVVAHALPDAQSVRIIDGLQRVVFSASAICNTAKQAGELRDYFSFALYSSTIFVAQIKARRGEAAADKDRNHC